MKYIKGHKFCIEERAKRYYGVTDQYSLAGYLLEDGSLLFFSYDGNQRDMDHRDIGYFFEKASGTDAIMKFIRRGNIRCSCDSYGFRFEMMKNPTQSQAQMMLKALFAAYREAVEMVLEKGKKSYCGYVACQEYLSRFL